MYCMIISIYSSVDFEALLRMSDRTQADVRPPSFSHLSVASSSSLIAAPSLLAGSAFNCCRALGQTLVRRDGVARLPSRAPRARAFATATVWIEALSLDNLIIIRLDTNGPSLCYRHGLQPAEYLGKEASSILLGQHRTSARVRGSSQFQEADYKKGRLTE
jgi:hypothetical protein